jgi:hypothetical protein
MTTPPTIYDQMDVRHWSPRTRRSLIAYLHGSHSKSLDAVIAEITAEQIYKASLKDGPSPQIT